MEVSTPATILKVHEAAKSLAAYRAAPKEDDTLYVYQEKLEPVSLAARNSLRPDSLEVLRQLFTQGPTWDGHIASKAGRDTLFDYGLATRYNGVSYLTEAGLLAMVGDAAWKKKTY